MKLAPGEDRTNIGDVFSSVYDQCIEFVTARIGEEMLLDGPTSAASQTAKRASLQRYSAERRKQSRASSRIVKVAARDLLRPYGYLVIALSVVLKIRRTLTGKEVNRLLADTHARYELAAERARRQKWQGVIENAACLPG